MSTIEREVCTVNDSITQDHKRLVSKDQIIAIVIIELLVLTWNCFDHSTPCWDTTVHRLGSLSAYELMRHIHLRSLEWYQHFFTINPLYPPLFYWMSGFLKLLLGKKAETELLVSMLFTAVLFFATYQLSLRSVPNRATACIAACFLFLSNSTFWATHLAILDSATNATVAVGLPSLSNWNKLPSWKNSIFLGISFALAVLAKSSTIAFFLGPILLVLGLAVKHRQHQRIGKFVFAAIVTIILLLPYLILSGPTTLAAVASIQQQSIESNDRLRVLLENIYLYIFEDMPGSVLGPFLMPLLVANLIVMSWKRSWTFQKCFLASSILIGIATCSSFKWLHHWRYIAPIIAPAAILAADCATRIWQSQNRTFCILLGAACLLAIFGSLINAFTPYPIQLPLFVSRAITKYQNLPENGESVYAQMGVSNHPIPPGDWGMHWVLEQLQTNSHGQLQILMVMPNDSTVCCSSLDYLISIDNLFIGAHTCRKYTLAGDNVEAFDQAKAIKEASWYLLKTGQQGFKLDGAVSQNNYDKWCSFIRESKYFRLFNEKELPDGSKLQLYRRVDAE